MLKSGCQILDKNQFLQDMCNPSVLQTPRLSLPVNAKRTYNQLSTVREKVRQFTKTLNLRYRYFLKR